MYVITAFEPQPAPAQILWVLVWMDLDMNMYIRRCFNVVT